MFAIYYSPLYLLGQLNKFKERSVIAIMYIHLILLQRNLLLVRYEKKSESYLSLVFSLLYYCIQEDNFRIGSYIIGGANCSFC